MSSTHTKIAITFTRMTSTERKAAYRRLRAEIEQLKQIKPHGRDYGTGQALQTCQGTASG